MKNVRPAIWLLLAIIVAMCVTYYTLGTMVSHPHKYVHNLGGDGGKNYYTYLQHALHGHGWWFTGMNYPYGEHIMFVDGQPALSITLSWLRTYIPLTAGSVTAILSLLMAFTFMLAIIMVYKILLRYKVSHLLAILFACCIVVLSTQNTRMFGLYGLSYVCIMPMIFYWFIYYHDTGKWKYMAYLFILTCIAMFLHPYQLALVLVWGALYVLGYSIFIKGERRQKLKHLLPVILLVILPAFIFKAVSSATDPVKDRPGYPHGLLSYGVTGEDIFTSPHSPIWLYLQEQEIIKPMRFEQSGYPYLGIAPALVLCIFILVFVSGWLGKKKDTDAYRLYGFSPLWFFIAFLALLYSMGVPFVWGLEKLYDYVASFRQFRSLGWFGLMFYHVGTVFTAVLLYHVSRRYVMEKKYILLVLLFVLPMSLWLFEGYTVAGELRKNTLPAPYNYDFFHGNADQPWPELLKEKGYKSSDFQGIILMPFYHVGSEKLWLLKSGWGMTLAMKAAFQLQLPVVDVNMSRSSWGQTFKQVKIGGGPYAYKPLLYEVKDNRPYLLMYFELDKLNPDDQYLFSIADSIGKTSNAIAYALFPEKLRQRDAAARAEIMQIATGMKAGDSSFPGKAIYYNHFDNGGAKNAFFGSQGLLRQGDSMLLSTEVKDWDKEKMYECSGWFNVNSKDYTSPSFELHFFDAAWNRVNILPVSVTAATDNHPMWFRASSFFTVPPECAVMQLYLRVRKHETYHGMDEVMIRLAEDTIISKDDKGRIMVNNHLLIPE